MSNPAQEEADRLFSSKDHHQISHPEDRDDHSDRDLQDDTDKYHNHSDPGTDDDYDHNLHNMATMTSTKTVFHLPATASYANTGPKGVIADAQSFARAKQMTFRQRLASIASNFGQKQAPQPPTTFRLSEKTSRDHSPESDLTMSEEELDSEFMQTWRANRVQELSSLSNQQQASMRRQSPSPRAWGTLQEVDANGYLDAIEKVASETIVVVFINNSQSQQSNEVEDLLEMLAYKHATTRFVKLNYEIAEMEAVEIPAILAYKGAEVFATISGADSENLEDMLKRRRILV